MKVDNFDDCFNVSCAIQQPYQERKQTAPTDHNGIRCPSDLHNMIWQRDLVHIFRNFWVARYPYLLVVKHGYQFAAILTPTNISKEKSLRACDLVRLAVLIVACYSYFSPDRRH